MIKKLFHRKSYYVLTFYYVLIFICTTILIEKPILPAVINDEYGYWLSAAFFSGKKWSSVAQGVAYYGYGYGLILSLVMRIFNDWALVYKVALLLNSVWLCLSFFFLIKISEIIATNISNCSRYFICFIVTLCSSNMCFINYTLPEVYLFFLHCLITWTFFSILKKASKKRMLLLAIEVTYAYAVHQRTIIVMMIIAIMLIYLARVKRICIEQLLMFIISMVIFLVFLNGLKLHVISEVWINNEITHGNDYLGQKDKILALLSSEGIYSFAQNICGRIVYFIISTFGIGYVVLKRMFTDIAILIKKKEVEVYNLFIISCILGGIIVSAIFLLYPDHTTHIFYGRYFENYYGPLLLIGLCDIYENKAKSLNKKHIIFGCVVLLFMVCYIKEGCEYRNIPIANYAINSVSMSMFYKFNNSDFYYGIQLVLGYIALMLILYIYSSKLKVGKYVSFLLILLLQIKCGSDSYFDFQDKYYDNLKNSTMEVCRIVLEINDIYDEKYDICVVDDNSGVFCAGAPIQYVLMKKNVNYFENVEKINDLGDKNIMISAGNITNIPEMHPVKKINLFTVWIANNNEELKEYFK